MLIATDREAGSSDPYLISFFKIVLLYPHDESSSYIYKLANECTYVSGKTHTSTP
uniref:Uncharacterized protein n=1 Tax=Arundo donax TaxID=35708 RepID=A0A0A9AAY7_ARUDO